MYRMNVAILYLTVGGLGNGNEAVGRSMNC